MKIGSILFLSAIIANLSAASAADIFTKYFAEVSGGKPCYTGYYERAHLSMHPKQTVRRIEVEFDQDRRDDKLNASR